MNTPQGALALPDPTPYDLVFASPADARTAAALTELWLSSKSEHTQKAYRRDLGMWLGWCARCKVSPTAARIAHVDAWIKHQRDTGGADKTVNRRVSAVSSWYDYLIVNTAQDPVPLATYNPGLTKARPRIDKDYSPTTALSHREIGILKARAREESLTADALIEFLLTLGSRVGAAMNARVEDLGHDGEHRTIELTLKGGKRDRKPLPPSLSQAVDAMLAERGHPLMGWLFTTRAGGQLYEVWVWRLVRKLIATCPHGIRATAITELLRAGVPLHQVQDFANHADPRTTQGYNKARFTLDNHGAYILAARFASPGTEGDPS